MNSNFEQKDADRIANIIARSKNNPAKAEQLAQTMAGLINKADKALRRALAAEAVERQDIADVFRIRWTELSGLKFTKVNTTDKPLPVPAADLSIKIRGVEFKRADIGKAARIYFWDETKGEGLAERFMSRYTPRTVFLPHVKEILEPVGQGDTKVRWSQHAGCSCPCSPGFILQDSRYRFDIHVSYEVVVAKKRKAS